MPPAERLRPSRWQPEVLHQVEQEAGRRSPIADGRQEDEAIQRADRGAPPRCSTCSSRLFAEEQRRRRVYGCRRNLDASCGREDSSECWLYDNRFDNASSSGLDSSKDSNITLHEVATVRSARCRRLRGCASPFPRPLLEAPHQRLVEQRLLGTEVVVDRSEDGIRRSRDVTRRRARVSLRLQATDTRRGTADHGH